MHKFSDLAVVKTNHPDADFWLQRKGSEETVGKPTREYSAENIGIKVYRRDVLDSVYCYYLLEHVYNTGYWQQLSRGTLRLQHITVGMVKDLKFGG